jgi:Putative Ig domain
MISHSISHHCIVEILGVACLSAVLAGCGGGSTGSSTHPGEKLSITSPALPDGMLTFTYNQTVQASGGTAPLSWHIVSGNLPHGLSTDSSSTNTLTISGVPDAKQTATFVIQVNDAANQSVSQSCTVKISNLASARLLPVTGQGSSGVIEIQGLSAGAFNPMSWQRGTLNWTPDFRMPLLAPLTSGQCQNIYAPWPLEQPTGWRLFYGGWDGSTTCNDRVYSVTTQDFTSFQNRTVVIDHGDFLHVNNENVSQLPDGSMHMICTIAVDQTSNGKPAYFSSPDGTSWNGITEPYSARLSDIVSIPNDQNYLGWDFNGGNVLLSDAGAWTLYYSVGIYGGIGQVYRATSSSPPIFQKTGIALNTSHYVNDVKKFSVGGKTWYLASLYVERATFDPSAPTLSYSLSSDGVTFGQEQTLFAGAGTLDKFLMTPSFVIRNGRILGVLYGGNPIDLLSSNQIFARWLQKQLVITDDTGAQATIFGAYGPDRLWLQVPPSGSITGNISVYAEDGVTPLGKGQVNLTSGQSYMLFLN